MVYAIIPTIHSTHLMCTIVPPTSIYQTRGSCSPTRLEELITALAITSTTILYKSSTLLQFKILQVLSCNTTLCFDDTLQCSSFYSMSLYWHFSCSTLSPSGSPPIICYGLDSPLHHFVVPCIS
uniref:Uncharacterized protein n=1 Tax=Cacopsylla melanoneura TaxID=428564 RepID=A0A8D8LUJ7_9HEMI